MKEAREVAGVGSDAAPLIVIGASAGGIDALSRLVGDLPAGLGAPVVIAQHLDRRRPSRLEEILARRTDLSVETVEGRAALRPGTIYVVPANRHAEIQGREVVALDGDGADGRHDGDGAVRSATGPKPSVDRLLRSAAEAYGEGLVAVILTGSGSDGADGARAVKAAGGTVVIQDPRTASFPSMPQSLAPATVDVVADLETMGPLLQELVAGPRPAAVTDERALRTLLEQLRERSGIDFSTYKTPTILRRLHRRMVATGTGQIGEYARYLQKEPAEYERLTSSFLIKVTGFFRDPELFDHLRERVMPELVQGARQRGNELRLWSAGCATGEEAYSLAMLVADALGEELGAYRVRVFATDLAQDAVDFARRGVYPASALSGVPAELVERHFTRLPTGEYEVKKRIRALTVFGQHDLGQRAPFPRIDLALCRNVLIYFTTELQRRALQLFAFALREGGYLALGKAETVSPLAEFFTVADSTLKVFRRHGGGTVNIPPVRIRLAPPVGRPAREGEGERRERTRGLGTLLAPLAPLGPEAAGYTARQGLHGRGALERAEGLLLQLPVGVVVVDRRYDVQLINGAARRLLGVHSPAVGEDFVHLAYAVPSADLREMIDAVFRGEGGDGAGGGGLGGVEEEGVRVLTAEPPVGEVRHVQVAVHPYRQDERGEPLAMVLVWDVTPLEERRRRLAEERARLEEELARRTATAERLTAANRELVRANQELTEMNAALHSANQELLLAHEEAQAATEEVETLNEELQATNEEQETLNEELQATVEELHTTNDDLQAQSAELQELAAALEAEREQLRAVLGSMSEAVLVLDATGAPLLANEAYERLFGAAQVGPPAGLVVVAAAAGIGLGGQNGAPRAAPFDLTFEHAAPEGRRRLEARGRPVAEEGGRRGLVITFREIDGRG